MIFSPPLFHSHTSPSVWLGEWDSVDCVANCYRLGSWI